MFTELSSRTEGWITQKDYEIKKPIEGFSRVRVSVKPYGVDNLSASYFIWGIKNGSLEQKTLAWDCGTKKEYLHEEVLNELLANAT